ncbi:MAG: hypothetical protein ACKO5K_14410 [Armatimonadota bacterium]
MPLFCLLVGLAAQGDAQDAPREPNSVKRPPYRPYFTSKSPGTSSSTARQIVDLRRSQRAKQYIPNEMGKVQEWNRWSVGGTDPWARSGSWDKPKGWEDPSAWKGDGLERTSRTLTYTRGRNPSASERHPVRSVNGSKR